MEWQCSSLQWVEHGNESKSVIWIFHLLSAVPDCPPPPSIRNGVVIVPPWGTPLYTVVEYFCKGGTRMVGNQTLECLESSEWSSDPPVCKGMVYTWQELRKWKFNEFLKYADLQSCQVSLICCGTEIMCAPLENPKNGGVILNNGTVYGAQAHYNCDNNFLLKGNNSRICQIDGNWSGKMPKCKSWHHSCKMGPVENQW